MSTEAPKHTPGNWNAEMFHNGGFEIWAEYEDGFRTIAMRHPSDKEERHSEYQANGRLIASAPDLLAYLKSAQIYLEHCVDIHSSDQAAHNRTVGGIRAAIARAEGRAS